jgi:imidazolonepropionase-like amidohydrolase
MVGREPGLPRGLIDAHVHISSSDGLADAVNAGVVGLRDAGMAARAGAGNTTFGPAPDGLTVVSAGWALYKSGGYGARFGVAVAEKDRIPSEVRRLADAGAGVIKVIASGMVSLRERDRITPGGFGPDELVQIVQEAGQYGLPVMAHANGASAIIACAEAGVRSVEHGFFMTERALEALAQAGCFWVPTIRALERAAEQSGVSEDLRSFVSGLVRQQQQMVRRAVGLGVRLAIGTDCTLPDKQYQREYRAEWDRFISAGLSAAEVAACATTNGCELLGVRTWSGGRSSGEQN